MLQCALPCFEGLLPKWHDRIVQNLLFEMATWHALAKLRMHTETTLKDLEGSSVRLCALLRKFKKEVCSKYQTKDLGAEVHARGRRAARKAKKAAEERWSQYCPGRDQGQISRFQYEYLQDTRYPGLCGFHLCLWDNQQHELSDGKLVYYYGRFVNTKLHRASASINKQKVSIQLFGKVIMLEEYLGTSTENESSTRQANDPKRNN